MNETLLLGSHSPEVGNWQRFLNRIGFSDWQGKELKVDEDFGQRTEYATFIWQQRMGLFANGQVKAQERELAKVRGFIPFVQARHLTPVHPKTRKIDHIVIHTMEAPEKPETAENVAAWFAGPSSPGASAHYCIDQDSVVQCVREVDVAWHAPGVNHSGIGLEHAGYARQSPAEWGDASSKQIVRRSALLAAEIAKRHSVPIQKISHDELRAGVRGFCGHIDATKAFPGPKRTHTDPGPFFPWEEYLGLVRSF